MKKNKKDFYPMIIPQQYSPVQVLFGLVSIMPYSICFALTPVAYAAPSLSQTIKRED